MEWRQNHSLVVATITPMHSDGLLNLGVMPAYVDYLISTGVRDAFVNGNGGECMSLTVNERKAVAEAWIKHGKNKMNSIIIQCGAGNIEESKELAAHAESIGADAIGCIGPSHFKPKDLDSLITYCATVAKSAPRTPFLYYHFPGLNGLNMDMRRFLNLAKLSIPTLVGLKFTSNDLHTAAQLRLIDDGRFDVFLGAECLMLPALTLNITNSIGVLWNLCGKYWHALFQAYGKKDLSEAYRQQMKIAEVFYLLQGNNAELDMHLLISGLKCLVSHASGVDMGPPRQPIQPRTEMDQANLVAQFKKLFI